MMLQIGRRPLSSAHGHKDPGLGCIARCESGSTETDRADVPVYIYIRPAQRFSNIYRPNFKPVQILLMESTGCVSGQERLGYSDRWPYRTGSVDFRKLEVDVSGPTGHASNPNMRARTLAFQVSSNGGFGGPGGTCPGGAVGQVARLRNAPGVQPYSSLNSLLKYEMLV